MGYNADFEGALMSLAWLFTLLIPFVIFYFVYNFIKKGQDIQLLIKCFTIGCATGYLLLFLTLSIKRGVTYFTENDAAYEPDSVKEVYYAMTILMYFFGKIALYSNFVYRLYFAFSETEFKIPNYGIKIYIFLLSMEALLAILNVIVWVEIRQGSDDKTAAQYLSFLSMAVVVVESCISVSVALLFSAKLMQLVIMQHDEMNLESLSTTRSEMASGSEKMLSNITTASASETNETNETNAVDSNSTVVTPTMATPTMATPTEPTKVKVEFQQRQIQLIKTITKNSVLTLLIVIGDIAYVICYSIYFYQATYNAGLWFTTNLMLYFTVFCDLTSLALGFAFSKRYYKLFCTRCDTAFWWLCRKLAKQKVKQEAKKTKDSIQLNVR